MLGSTLAAVFGSSLSAALHPDIHAEQEWKGRCTDLSKVYKQVPVSQSSRPFAVLRVHHHETGRPVNFLSNNLPLGASANVFDFNRISGAFGFLQAAVVEWWGSFLRGLPFSRAC